MLKHGFIFSLLLLIVLNAESAEQLSTPQNVRIAAEKQLTKCTSAVEKHVPVGNQLISDGLTSCYSRAKSIFIENIEHAAKRIEQSKDTNCRKLYTDLEEKSLAYAENLANTPSLGNAPLNTDDDLEILILAHRYEIAYAIAGNSACN